MKKRTVAHILKSEPLQMGHLEVKQPLPTMRVEQISPFLLLHHFGPMPVEPGADPLDLGPHPHRGFEPVTFLYSGGIRHKDSRGNEGILQGGDVQWMTAGRGIIHSERASKAFLESGGVMEGIQLWVNLPKQHKMAQPGYQDIKTDRIPVLEEDEGRVQLKVVAGAYKGLKGPAKTFTPIIALQARLQPGGAVDIELPEHFNALAYILSGTVKLNGNFSYGGEHLLHFRNDGEGFGLQAEAESQVLILAGEPIDEPLASWGPYVMNTQTEIMEAMRDYQMGKMGVYVD
ncbi:MAG: pirin family protein [Phaeodactylibacter sp.]|nr:pirin family protein [Phaeodactylibacter sp.]